MGLVWLFNNVFESCCAKSSLSHVPKKIKKSFLTQIEFHFGEKNIGCPLLQLIFVILRFYFDKLTLNNMKNLY
jgi:hypothetical protein